MLAQLASLGADLAGTRVLWFSTPDERRRVGDLIVAATEAIIDDPQQSADSAKWFRTSWQQLQTMCDGITLDAQSLPPVSNAMGRILPPLSRASADKAWLGATRERQVATAAAFGPCAEGAGRRSRHAGTDAIPNRLRDRCGRSQSAARSAVRAGLSERLRDTRSGLLAPGAR